MIVYLIYDKDDTLITAQVDDVLFTIGYDEEEYAQSMIGEPKSPGKRYQAVESDTFHLPMMIVDPMISTEAKIHSRFEGPPDLVNKLATALSRHKGATVWREPRK